MALLSRSAVAPLHRSNGPLGLTGPGLVVLLIGAFLPVMSFFIVNVTLPAIGRDLHASAAALQLVVACYGITNAALVVVGGRLGDGLGRRRLFVVGLTGFTVTALLSGFAPTLPALLVARAAQGVFAALLTPQVLSTITATRQGEERARAIGFFGASAGLAAAAGQVLGGWLVEADVAGLGWRANFLVAVPVGLVALALTRRTVPETRAEDRLPVDATGATLLGGTLVVLLFPLSEGRPLHWPFWIWAVLAVVVPIGVGLGYHQTRAERLGRTPLVPPSVLALREMRIGLANGLAFFTSFGGFMFVFALATQTGAGLSPLEGGLALGPFALAFLVVSIAGPRLQRRWGPSIIARGWVLSAVGYAATAGVAAGVWPHVDPVNLAGPLVLVGLGNGLVMLPLMGVVLGQVPTHQAGLASGLLITTQQTCLALGAATVGTLYLALAGGSLGAGRALEIVSLLLAVVGVLMVPVALRLRPRRQPVVAAYREELAEAA
ncbi:MFS transporter [Nocardioides mangrovicus]|uniref:MFS transporter n=1 Tax=Nocardioides mangrovicus TaxID=2478913 RepID=A0A3L8P3N1_9ACTN|nr:MFS transporter [Nocardioides mangrovicus]RLV49632.1 MFS transporter [Nocardioides mangrovicus]